jgi:hypothetical protein
MGFSKDDLPPIFEYIIQKIIENDGKISTEEFRQLLYSLRIEKEDIKDIKTWLKEKGYIMINHGYQNETIELIKKFDGTY